MKVHSTSNMSRDLSATCCLRVILPDQRLFTKKIDMHGHRLKITQLLDASNHRAPEFSGQPTPSRFIVSNILSPLSPPFKVPAPAEPPDPRTEYLPDLP